MKAKELMVGDWVMHGKKKRKCYNICGHTNDVMLDNGVFTNVMKINPMPLTLEILEKNGFERTWQDNFVYDNENIGLIITFHPKETNYTNGTYNYIDIERGCMTITEMPIAFVHEFQHAMRLCGIEEEIIV